MSGGAMVTCASCRARIPQSESAYSNDGDLLCLKCHGFEGAHAQIERGRQAEIEAGYRGGGVAGAIAGAINEARANTAAAAEHRDLANIHAAQRGHSGMAPAAAQQCQNCGTMVAPSDGSYTTWGTFVCVPCSHRADEAVLEQRIKTAAFNRKVAIGVVCFLVLGILAFYLLGRFTPPPR